MEVFELKEENDCILATVNMHKFDFAHTEILDIIGYAEVLELVEMREFTACKLKTILKLYDRDI